MSVEEIRLTDVEHLRLPHLNRVPPPTTTNGLPYHDLGGPGLERLCFLWLRSQGLLPRLYGRSGQADRGVDLLVEQAGLLVAYQCKNLRSFSPATLQQALAEFEEAWLNDPHAPHRPEQFCLFAPIQLISVNDNDKWLVLSDDFQKRTTVPVSIVHKGILDADLHRLPDVVADLFGDRMVRTYCHIEDWLEDLFIPVRPDIAERRVITPFFDLKSKGGLARDDRSERLEHTLNDSGLVLIYGAAGAGKTTAALQLATTVRDGSARAYYVSLSYEVTELQLLQGVSRRTTHNAIFVIDDCHLDFERVSRMLERLERTKPTNPIQIILVAQDAGLGEEKNELLELCNAQRVAFKYETDLYIYRQIVSSRHPNWPKHLWQSDLNLLYQLTRGDLYLLSVILDHVSSAETLRNLNTETVFAFLNRRYFNTIHPHAPVILRIAALAQFKIALRQSDLTEPLAPSGASWKADRTIFVAGRPPEYLLIHESTASILFRALLWANGTAADAEAAVGNILKEHLRILRPAPERWVIDFRKYLHSFANTPSDFQQRLRRLIALDEEVWSTFLANSSSMPLSTLNVFLRELIDAQSANAAALKDIITERIRDLFRGRTDTDGRDLNVLGYALAGLRNSDPDTAALVEKEIEVEDLLALMRGRGTILALFRMLTHVKRDFMERTISSLDDALLDALIDRTIASNEFPRKFVRRFRFFDQATRVSLEQKFGAARIARFLTATGTAHDVVNVMVNTSKEFNFQLLDGADALDWDKIIERTLRLNSSISILQLNLRDLHLRDRDMLVTAAFERAVGTERFVKLILANGNAATFLILLYTITPQFIAALLGSINESALANLVQAAISAGTGLRHVNFTIRRLKREAPEAWLRLSAMMTPSLWWTWTMGSGDLRTMSYIAAELSEDEQKHLFGAAELTSATLWDSLLQRGDLHSVAHFASSFWDRLPQDVRPLLLKAAMSNAMRIGEISDWYALHTGYSQIRRIGDPELRVALGTAYETRLDSVDWGREHFSSASEATNALMLIHRTRPTLLEQLGERIWDVVPSLDDWGASGERRLHRLAVYKHLLSLCKSRSIVDGYARYILENASLVFPEALKEERPHEIYLFFWNLASLWFERKRNDEPDLFPGFDDAIIDALVERIQATADTKMTNLEKVDWLGLAGFIVWIKPHLKKRLDSAVRGRMRGGQYLLEAAEGLTFIPRFFSFLGLEFVLPKNVVFTTDRCEALRQAADKYEFKSPSIEWVLSEIARRQPVAHA